jgi:hypothetical protein
MRGMIVLARDDSWSELLTFFSCRRRGSGVSLTRNGQCLRPRPRELPDQSYEIDPCGQKVEELEAKVPFGGLIRSGTMVLRLMISRKRRPHN